ncbi:uncharacterized protein LOC117101236 isoform X2 [Anneissia japonica]|uniref:uncharacterized protein LOC117101236 isoform X2 n=1 Tax=Anneissia japonica TaxID=1529436 RepID=UPI0014256EC7|nr:uncharacterized protein LOC117101236 isoform X2 [Anneissia japonica]
MVNKYHVIARCMSQRRVLLAVLWYSLAISLLGIYYTHIHTKDKNLLLRVSNSLQLTHSAIPSKKYASLVSRHQTQELRIVTPNNDEPNNLSVITFNRNYIKQHHLPRLLDGATAETKSDERESLNMMDIRNMPGQIGINWYEIDKAIDWKALEKEELRRVEQQHLNYSLVRGTEKPLYLHVEKNNSNINITNSKSRIETNSSNNLKKYFFPQQPKNKTFGWRQSKLAKSGQLNNQSRSVIEDGRDIIRKPWKKLYPKANIDVKQNRINERKSITNLARQSKRKVAKNESIAKDVSDLTQKHKKEAERKEAKRKEAERKEAERKKEDIEEQRLRNISRELMKKELFLMKTKTLSPKAAAKKADGYFKVSTNKHLHLHCNWCAVISSSGRLLNQSAGKEIDQFPCVIRMNTSPTKGYEEDVGSKTTVRVIGHVNLLKINQSNSLQDEFFVDKVTAAEKNLIPWLYNVRVNKKTDKFYKVVKNFSHTFQDTEFYLLSGSKMRHAEQIFRSEIGISRREARTWLSTGWMTLLFAMDICEKIHVYGLVPENYCNNRINDSTPYHYYESDGLLECDYYKASEEQLRYGHLFVTEKAVFGRWAVKHNIAFHYPEWNLTRINTTAPLETPFVKMYRAAKLNETLMQKANKTKVEMKESSKGLLLRKNRIKFKKTSSKYVQFSSAMMMIMAVFFSMVAFLLLFLFLSLLLLCFYL